MRLATLAVTVTLLTPLAVAVPTVWAPVAPTDPTGPNVGRDCLHIEMGVSPPDISYGPCPPEATGSLPLKLVVLTSDLTCGENPIVVIRGMPEALACSSDGTLTLP